MRFQVPGDWSAPTRCNAAIGGMRDARIAGNTAATIVTPMPTMNDQTMAFVGIVIELAGMSTPNAASSGLEQDGERHAADEPEDGRDDADERGFEQHRPDDLAAAWRRWPAAAPSPGRAGPR